MVPLRKRYGGRVGRWRLRWYRISQPFDSQRTCSALSRASYLSWEMSRMPDLDCCLDTVTHHSTLGRRPQLHDDSPVIERSSTDHPVVTLLPTWARSRPR